MRSARLPALAISIALSLPVVAASPRTEEPPAAAAVRQALSTRFPDISIVGVQPAPVAGLFEVFTGDAIAYSNASGDYLLLGTIMDTRSRHNLTADRMDELNAIDFESLPFAQAIKVVKGDGRRRIAVFADPECPYCQELEHELATINDVTVYTFLYPLAAIHPDAPAKARAIWCSKDRAGAWSGWMLEKHDPKAESPCDERPLDDTRALGAKLRINSTPTLFLPSGKRVSGALSAAQLEEALKEAPGAPTAQR